MLTHRLKNGSKVIDISEHNGSVNFQEVKRAGIDGVIIRAAYVGSTSHHQHRDSLFTAARVKAIHDADLAMGVYIYSIPRRNARGSGDLHYLLKTVEDVSGGLRPGIDLKPILDVEESNLDRRGNSQWLQDAHEYAQQHGNTGLIGYAAIAAIPFAGFVNIPAWVANPGTAPGHPHGLPGFAHSVAMHQYTFTGKVPGVHGPCDESMVLIDKHITLPHRSPPIPTHPPPLYIFPVKGPFVEGRTDRGVDLETHPHAEILAVGDCEVTAIQHAAISSLGQIVMRLDHPWHFQGKVWRYAYVFHLHHSQIKVRRGDKLKAGRVIATSAAQPPGAEHMPGHIEYGFALAEDGRIDQNVGPDHFAPSGAAMHALFRHLNPHHIRAHPIRSG